MASSTGCESTPAPPADATSTQNKFIHLRNRLVYEATTYKSASQAITEETFLEFNTPVLMNCPLQLLTFCIIID